VTRILPVLAALALAAALLHGQPGEARDALLPAAEGGFGYAYGPWRSSRIGGAGNVRCVVPAPSQAGVCYAFTDSSTLLRTTDGGRLWRMVQGNIPGSQPGDFAVRSIAVSPADADVVLAALGNGTPDTGGLWRSEDGGATWQKVLAQPFDGAGNISWMGAVVAFDPSNAQRVWAATCAAGVWVSEDGGQTWQPRGLTALLLSGILLDRTDPQRVWVGASAPRPTDYHRIVRPGLWVTHDAGESWRRLYTDRPCVGLVQDARDPDTLYEARQQEGVAVSRDGGTTWQPMNKGLETEAGAALPICRSVAADGQQVLAGAGGAVRRFRLGGDAWEPFPAAAVAGSTGRVQPDPHAPGAYWMCGSGGAWYAAAGSSGAVRLMDGIECADVTGIAAGAADPRVVHIGTAGSGYMLSLDGAQTFDSLGGPAKYVRLLAASAAAPGIVYCVGGPTLNSGRVYVSLDYGRTWRKRDLLGLPWANPSRIESLAAAPGEPGLLYALVTHPYRGGIYRSEDGGVSWQPSSRVLAAHCATRRRAGAPAPQVVADAGGTLYALAGAEELHLWVSPDRGSNWTPIQLPEDLGRPLACTAHPSLPGTLVIASDAGLWRTSDGGANWARLSREPATTATFCGEAPENIAFVSGPRVMLSTDAGASWQAAAGPPLWPGALPCWTAGRLMLGTRGSGVFWAATEDGGRRPAPSVELPEGPAEDPSHRFPIPAIRNGDMESAGDAAAAGWQEAWGQSGLPLVHRSRDAHSGRHSLALESRESSVVTVTQSIEALPYAFRVEAWMKYEGSDFGHLGISTWDANGDSAGWLRVASIGPGDEWVQVATTVVLPRRAVRANLTLMLRRPGTVLLDDVAITHP
jgi:photosystem II stability/assembly factor-like uncharacterized protein